jgi:hypothetical protein
MRGFGVLNGRGRHDKVVRGNPILKYGEYKMRYYHIWFQTKFKGKYGAKEVAMNGLQAIADYARNQKKDLHVV